jgi:hypothetical protein
MSNQKTQNQLSESAKQLKQPRPNFIDNERVF